MLSVTLTNKPLTSLILKDSIFASKPLAYILVYRSYFSVRKEGNAKNTERSAQVVQAFSEVFVTPVGYYRRETATQYKTENPHLFTVVTQ